MAPATAMTKTTNSFNRGDRQFIPRIGNAESIFGSDDDGGGDELFHVKSRRTENAGPILGDDGDDDDDDDEVDQLVFRPPSLEAEKKETSFPPLLPSIYLQRVAVIGVTGDSWRAETFEFLQGQRTFSISLQSRDHGLIGFA